MTAFRRLGLGTAQFGAHYGIKNRSGRPSETEVAAILAHAMEMGVGYLDTASGYGDAERLIGKLLPKGHGLRIVTKFPAISEPKIENRHKALMLDALARSLERLRADQIYGVLIHQAADFAKPGAARLAEALLDAKTRGWVARIGASVYDVDELALAESHLQPELVQLPCNVLDRRFIATGALARLKARGVEVHARSVFLQGLLLMAPSEIPEFFAPMREAIHTLRERWASQGRTPLKGCLDFALGIEDIDTVILGVNRLSQLKELEAVIGLLSRKHLDIEPVTTPDPVYLDPRRWRRTPGS